MPFQPPAPPVRRPREESRADLAVIVSTVAEIARTNLDLPATMALITERTQELTGASAAAVELAEGEDMVYRAVSGSTQPFLGLRLKIASSLSGLCVRTGQVLRCDDAETDPRVDKEACRKINVRSMIVVPLHHEERVAGVLKVMSPEPAAFHAGDVQTLQLMAGLMGSTLARSELISTLNEEIHRRREAQLEAEAARRQAEAASRAKSDFLASMSHEIRTPMNAIIGMAELLAETPLSEEQQEYVRILSRAGTSLLDLINDILDLSKIEAGHLDLELAEFDLIDLAESTAEVLAVRAHSKGLELACRLAPDLPHTVRGDSTRVRQVLVNLLGNAIKFTSRGEVVLSVEGSEARPDMLHFCISDTGVGIPESKLDAIWDDFTQADASTTRQYGGTGLGLSICRRLVASMGGKIWAESRLGAGSAFHFELPLPAVATPQPAEGVPEIDLTNVRALVVDDNATNRLILQEALRSWGAQVTEAEDGMRAVARFEAAAAAGRPFDLVLIDCRMPLMDGFQVAEALQHLFPVSNAAVMMLTSDNRSGDVSRARALGFGSYLVKPLKRSDLLHAIRITLGRARKAEEKKSALPAPAPSVERSLRILLADDSADNRLLIRSYLKNTPHQLEMAENGLQALEQFTENQYDLVLMDMLMPVMDGCTATRAIRAWEHEHGRRATPIVALTANAMKEDVERSLAAGCTAHVTKPVKKATLLQAVTDYTSP